MVERKRESEIRERDRVQDLDDERTASPMGGNRRSASKKTSTNRTTSDSSGKARNRKKK